MTLAELYAWRPTPFQSARDKLLRDAEAAINDALLSAEILWTLRAVFGGAKR